MTPDKEVLVRRKFKRVLGLDDTAGAGLPVGLSTTDTFRRDDDTATADEDTHERLDGDG